MIKLGNNDITLKVGNNDVSAAYLGSTLVYSRGTPPTPTFDGKWLATYSDLHTESATCDSSSAITSGEIQTHSAVTSVEIGQCVTSIEQGAFKNCKSLTSVTIGSGVTYIGASAFQVCTSLTSITIPNSVTYIDNYAFRGCSGLTNITIPDSLTTIGDSTFSYCRSLTSVTIPNSVTSIGVGAFRVCSGLTSIIIEATTPPTLGSGAFDDTNNCVIYVPAQSVETYQETEEWINYGSRIQAIGGGENPNSGGNPDIGGIDDEDLPPDN